MAGKRKEHVLTCACFDIAQGWIDAGCPFHGIKSSLGRYDFYAEAEKFRRALMPDLKMRREARTKWD